MTISAVPTGAHENPFQLNSDVLPARLPKDEKAPAVSIPDALAALSEPEVLPEPVSETIPETEPEAELESEPETEPEAELESEPEAEPEPELKFANITAGETLEVEELVAGDNFSESEAEMGENDKIREEMIEQVATCAPVLAALPEKKQAEPKAVLRTDELRELARPAPTEQVAKKAPTPKAAVDAAAEIGLSSSAPKQADKGEDPPVRQEVALFSGPNSAIYVKAWEGLKSESILRSGCWSLAGFVFSIAWFAYRRLYSIAMVWLIVMAAVAVYAPNLIAAVLASAMICGGFWGKILYARHADQMIRSKIRSASEPDEYIASLVRAGGVSLPMGIFVGVLAGGLFILPNLQLPGLQ